MSCEQYTHKDSTYRVAQHDHIASREHAWLKLERSGLHIFVSLKQLSSKCHVSFLAAPDTDHKHKFSPTSPIFPTISPTHTRPLVHDPYLPCEFPRQSSGSTQIRSLTGYEPHLIETGAIEPEDLEPRKIEFDRNLGTDPHQIQ